MELEEIYARYLEDRATEVEIRYLLRCFNDPALTEEVAVMVDRHLAAGTRLAATRETELDAAVREVYAALRPQRSAYWGRFWPLAAAVLISAVAMVCWLRPVVKQQQLVTRAGERKIIELSDGTKIWLSPSGALRYPDQFNSDLREVQLEGEAYFEVAKDKAHPFIVHSRGMATRVVGTAFMIDSAAVTVVSGIVQVSAANAVTLQPGQRAVLAGGRLRAEPYPAAVVLKRRDGILAYNGATVGQVVADLSRYYNLRLELRGNPGCRCFGEFNTNEPIVTVLAQLTAAIGAKVETRNGHYIISGGCR